MVSFSVSQKFSVSPNAVYKAWLNSAEHTSMTGGQAICSDKEGGEFFAWDGYISGVNVELNENQKIVQKWRTTEFSNEDDDSLIEIIIEDLGEQCRVTLNHSNIPDGQSDYKKGWIEHYFEPMLAYFG